MGERQEGATLGDMPAPAGDLAGDLAPDTLRCFTGVFASFSGVAGLGVAGGSWLFPLLSEDTVRL